jgi:hypothetical protein
MPLTGVIVLSLNNEASASCYVAPFSSLDRYLKLLGNCCTRALARDHALPKIV